MLGFRFSVLSWKHKMKYIRHKLLVIVLIGVMIYVAVAKTNPVLITREEKMSVSIGMFIGAIILVLSLFKMLKSAMQVKFLAFLVAWIILMSLQAIMSTLIWTIGLSAIPLMIDDIIIIPYWGKVWYNFYER